MRVAVVQRILAPYRVPVFDALARRAGMDLTVLHGRGTRTGPWQGAREHGGARTRRLFTLAVPVRLGRREHYFAFHPGLIRSLSSGCYDAVLAEGSTNLLDNVFLTAWCRATRTPLVFWDAGRIEAHPPSWLRRLHEPLIRAMLLRADACVTYGRTTTWYFRRIGIAPEAIFVAPNTVDLARIELNRAAWASREDEIGALRQRLDLRGRRVVLHVGSLQRNKPLDPLLRACSEIERRGTPVALIIVGDGRGRRRLESLARTFGLQGVRFLGRLTEDLGSVALLADVAAFPHGSTLGIQTALGYGLPVIAGVGRSPEHEAIEPGFNGLLVPPGDGRALADALESVFTNRVSLASAEAIRDHVRLNFSLERMVDGLQQAIHWAVGRRDRVDRVVPDGLRGTR